MQIQTQIRVRYISTLKRNTEEGGGGKRPRRQLRRFVSSKLQFSSVQPALLQLARRPLQLRIERLDQVQQAALGSRGGGADILRDATEGEFEACDGC